MEGRMIPSKGTYFFAHFMLIGNITPNMNEFQNERRGAWRPYPPILDSLFCKTMMLLSMNDITHSSTCK